MPAAAIALKHIRFLAEPGPGQSVRRRFTQPRRMAVVEEPFELASLPMDLPWPEALDDLFVVVAPAPLPADLRDKIEAWLAPPPDRPDAPQAVIVELEQGAIRWRPGRAAIECAPNESLLAALTEFAFYESELRRLEQALVPYESSAAADAALAYRIERSSRAEWDRLAETMQALSGLRLTFARLEPLLAATPRNLDRDGRRAASGLALRSGMAPRLEAFGNRLEACEDLYEGAVDRITDFRWYRKGEILETIIVVLLALEAMLLAWQMLGPHII